MTQYHEGNRVGRDYTLDRNVRGKRTRNPGWEPGNHWVQCDRCACAIRAEDAMVTWDNLIVCPDDWEIRHPQDFVRGRHDQILAREPRRSESQDVFVEDGDDVDEGINPGLQFISDNIEAQTNQTPRNARTTSFNTSGTMYYVVMQGATANLLRQYNVPDFRNIATIEIPGTDFTINPFGESTFNYTIEAHLWNPDGSAAWFSYRSGAFGTLIVEFVCTTPFDITTSSYSGRSLDISPQTGSTVANGLDFNFDGSILILSAGFNYFSYDLSTEYDITTATVSISGNWGFVPNKILFNKTGERVYTQIAVSGNIRILEYVLDIPYDISFIANGSDQFQDIPRDPTLVTLRSFCFAPDDEKAILYQGSASAAFMDRIEQYTPTLQDF